MTTSHKFILPGDFIINLIFKQYGSKDFYKKFKNGGYIFSPEITKEWRESYMNPSLGVCGQDEFFNNVSKWRDKYNKEFPTGTLYEVAIAHILPIAAPTFFEQATISI